MAKSCVLITRPSSSGGLLCNECRKFDLEALHHPIIEIEPINRAFDLTADVFAITSQNAVTDSIISQLDKQAQVFAVGPQTAQALRKAGYTKVKTASGNGTALLAELKQLPKAKKVVHLCGDQLRVDVAVELAKLGYDAKSVKVYNTKTNPNLPEYMVNKLIAQQVQLLPIFSPRTAEMLLDCFEKQQINTDNITAICISEAVADIIKNKSWKNIVVSSRITAEYLSNYADQELHND